MKISGAIFAIMCLVVLLSNCSKNKQTCGSCSAISFKNDVIPVFKSSCAVSGCHTGHTPAGNLNLDSAVAYTNVTTVSKGYIHTGDPNSSILYIQMIPGSSQPMPPTGLLDACISAKISCWIQQGALNN